MSDDRFLEKLREEAQSLRFEPADDLMYVRLQARVRSRIQAPVPTVSQLLVRWFRPLGVSLAAIALAATIVAGFEQQQHDATATLDSITASAESPSLGEEFLSGE